jgi:hypothetical protein
MGEAVVKFGEIEAKIKEKMKATFLEMIPEHAWDRLAQEYLGKNGKNIIEPLLKEVLTEFYKEALKRWVSERHVELERLFVPSLGATFAEACQMMSKDILNQLSKQTAHAVLNVIRNEIRMCASCNAQVPYGTQYCPRCNNYVS